MPRKKEVGILEQQRNGYVTKYLTTRELENMVELIIDLCYELPCYLCLVNPWMLSGGWHAGKER